MIHAIALLALVTQAPFVLVMIDQKTEAALGQFPYDRGVLAAAVQRSTELGARGVVIKFFMPGPSSDIGDRALAAAMKRTKVLLQAGGFREDPKTNSLPERFKLMRAGGNPQAMDATYGTPLPMFAAEAYDIGFVDMDNAMSRAPMIEHSQGFYVKSLWTACLELALNVKAEIHPGISVKFGDRTLPLTGLSEVGIEFPQTSALDYISLVDFLHDRRPRPEVKDRIVLLGAVLPRVQPPLQTSIGPLGPHRIFYYALLSLYESLTK